MTRTITVAPSQSMTDVLNGIRIAAGDELIVEIPADASVLLTANEFRALSIAAERDEVEISIYTDDPLRRQLAGLFGVPLVNEIPQPLPYVAPALEPLDQTEEFVPVTTDESLADDDEESDLESDAIDSQTTDGRSSNWRWLGGLAAVLGIAALCMGLYWLFFSSMTVDLHLQREKVASTLSYQVTDPGVSTDGLTGIAIAGQPVSFSLSLSQQVPATGQTIIPDKTASGELVLRNPSDAEVSIEKGMTFEGFGGATYLFADGVDVPAAADGQPGETTAKIEAAEGGEAGNTDIGMLTGQLPNGIYYSNRTTPVAGGTQKTITTVSQEDLDKLQAGIDQQLLALATTTELEDGLLLVPSSIVPRNSPDNYDFSNAVGDEVSEISVTATVPFDATAYDSSPLTSAAIPQLEGEVTPGNTFDPDSVHVNTPAETGSTNGVVSMLATVSGEAVPTLDQATKDGLADELSGNSASENESILAGLDYADSYAVEFSPSWLPDRVPSSSGRIEIETS